MFKHFQRLRIFRPNRLYTRNFVSPLTPEQGQQALRSARQALINNVEGFFPRQRLRLRLFLMGQVRPMKMDDALALLSWFFLGHSIFILVGTTTFVSVMIVVTNSFNIQGSFQIIIDYFADYISELLTFWTGYNITFESASVPWRLGTIRLENVKIVCNEETWKTLQKKIAYRDGVEYNPGEVNTNFAYWDTTVESIDVTLSLWRWLDGFN